MSTNDRYCRWRNIETENLGSRLNLRILFLHLSDNFRYIKPSGKSASLLPKFNGCMTSKASKELTFYMGFKIQNFAEKQRKFSSLQNRATFQPRSTAKVKNGKKSRSKNQIDDDLTVINVEIQWILGPL